jgi:hypothetical protein
MQVLHDREAKDYDDVMGLVGRGCCVACHGGGTLQQEGGLQVSHDRAAKDYDMLRLRMNMLVLGKGCASCDEGTWQQQAEENNLWICCQVAVEQESSQESCTQ